jgi:hypothetical protein
MYTTPHPHTTHTTHTIHTTPTRPTPTPPHHAATHTIHQTQEEPDKKAATSKFFGKEKAGKRREEDIGEDDILDEEHNDQYDYPYLALTEQKYEEYEAIPEPEKGILIFQFAFLFGGLLLG